MSNTIVVNAQPTPTIEVSAVGARGFDGAQGATGAQGLDGAYAAQGVQGQTGAQGADGVQGGIGAGIQGQTGAQGSTGSQGAIGQDGVIGYDGAQGATGSQGATGLQGVQGLDGAYAAQGIQGATGIQGLQSNTVVTTAEFTAFNNQTVFVIADEIADVQYAVVSRNGITLVPNTHYTVYGNTVTLLTGCDANDLVEVRNFVTVGLAYGLQGVQGTTGIQGVQGTTGPIGLTGDTGETGLTGDAGPQGTDGAQGSTGAQGVQGIQGIIGVQGLDGAYAAQGIQGSTGAGAQGADGAQGPAGADGNTGDVGPEGPAGVQGVQGIQGNAGYVGSDGAQGAVGSQGAIGAQGTDGSQGATGSGAQGATGATGISANTNIYSSEYTATANQNTFAIIDSVDGDSFVIVTRNGIVQAPNTHYTVSGNTVTFTYDCDANDLVEIRQFTSISVGVQGATGATGAQGVQGLDGAYAAQGIQGATGAQVAPTSMNINEIASFDIPYYPGFVRGFEVNWTIRGISQIYALGAANNVLLYAPGFVASNAITANAITANAITANTFGVVNASEVNTNTLYAADDIHIKAVSSTPVAPSAGNVAIFATDTLAGRIMPAYIGPSGLDTALQPLLARNKIAYIQWSGSGAFSNVAIGMGPPTYTGTQTVRTPNATSLYHSVRRLGWLSAATAGANASARLAVGGWMRGNTAAMGGFTYVMRAGICDPAPVANAVMFVGFRNTTTLIANSTNPLTLTNVVGFAQIPDSNNIHIISNAGSGTAHVVDTGLQCNVGNTAIWDYAMFAAPNDTQIQCRVSNILNVAQTFSHTITANATNMPLGNTTLTPYIWRSNFGAAQQVGHDLISLYIETDF